MIRVFITPNVILLLGDYVIRSSRNTNGTISAIILKVECGGTFRNRIFEEHRNYIINIPRLPIAISTNSSEEHFGIKFSLIVIINVGRASFLAVLSSQTLAVTEDINYLCGQKLTFVISTTISSLTAALAKWRE